MKIGRGLNRQKIVQIGIDTRRKKEQSELNFDCFLRGIVIFKWETL